MSIGIYAFLRIVFNALACPFGRALSDTLHALQRRRRYDLPGTACLVSGADRCSVSSVQGVCTGAWSVVVGLACIWHGLRCCLLCAAVPGALGAGVSTGGVYSHRPAPPGQSFNHRKNKKGSKIAPTPIANLKNFPQKQKDPYKGSVFCAILDRKKGAL